MSLCALENRHQTLRFPGGDAALVTSPDGLHFVGLDGAAEIDCYVTRMVLEQLEGAPLDAAGCVSAFRRHRSAIHAMAARQYEIYGRNPQGTITVTLADL